MSEMTDHKNHPCNIQWDKQTTKAIQLIAISLCLFYLPILLNNIYYRDDWDRAIREIANFRAFGRVFGGYFAHFITADFVSLTETTPLFFVCSIFILGLSSFLTLKIRRVDLDILSAFIVVIFLFNPFLVDALLYRYDCLIMSVSYASALLAWAIFPKKQLLAGCLLIVSLGTYQPFINLFLLLTAAELILKLVHGQSIKQSFVELFRALLVFIIVFLIYRFLIIPAYNVKTARSALIALDASGIKVIFLKFKEIHNTYVGILSTTGKILYAICGVVALAGIFKLIQKNATHYMALRFIIVCVLLFCVYFLSYGPFLLLNEVGIAPRMIAPIIVFSCLLSYFSIYFVQCYSPNWLTCILALLIALCPLSFSYAVNNAMAEQDKFENFILSDLASSLLKTPQTEKIVLSGSMPLSPLNHNVSKRYKTAGGIVIETPAWVSRLRLSTYGLANTEYAWNDEKADTIRRTLCQSRTPPTITSKYYKIYQYDGLQFVWLGDKQACAN